MIFDSATAKKAMRDEVTLTLRLHARIPLRRRDGAVVAWAMVDPQDLKRFAMYRWFRNPDGYAVRSEYLGRDGKKIRVRRRHMHREVLSLELNDGLIADHINRNRLDNRRENLRVVRRAGNNQNREKQKTHKGNATSSRFRGVSWHKGEQKWFAYSREDGRLKSLGLHRDELEAARVAAEHRAKHMPFAEPDAFLEQALRERIPA